MDPFPKITDKKSRYTKQAQNQLADIGKTLNVPIEKQTEEIGDPKIIIPAYIDKHGIDLPIVGHHEKHGIYQGLGLTTYGLISHAKCNEFTIPFPAYNEIVLQS